MLTATYDIVDVQWMSTTENWLADLLSRFQFEQIANTHLQLLVLQKQKKLASL